MQTYNDGEMSLGEKAKKTTRRGKEGSDVYFKREWGETWITVKSIKGWQWQPRMGTEIIKKKNIIVDYIDLIILILLMWGLYSLKLLEYGFFKIWIVLLIGQHECEGWLWLSIFEKRVCRIQVFGKCPLNGRP